MRDELHPVMKAALVFIGAAILLLGLAGGVVDWSGEKTSVSDDAGIPNCYERRLDREVSRGMRVSRPEWGAEPVLSFDSFRVVKPRLFGFSLGGFNLIEIDNLRIVLTEPLLQQEPDTRSEEPDTRSEEVAGSRWGGLSSVCSVAALKRAAGIETRVSGLRVFGLSLCAVGFDGALTEILFASSARSIDSSRFLLKECELMDEKLVLQQAARAELDIKNGLIVAGPNRVEIESIVRQVIEGEK